MKFVTVDKKDWATGLERAKKQFRLFGPLKENQFYNFKKLGQDEQPDFTFSNTRLSPKSIIYSQSEVLFKYSLDKSRDDHHQIKDIEHDDSHRAIIGIRPCDAKSFLLVKRNFDTPEYKDPFWIQSYERTTFIGLACNTPCNTCFCTTAGCGPFHEEGLDLLLIDSQDSYMVKVLTDKGKDFLKSASWHEALDADVANETINGFKADAESKIKSKIFTDQLKNKNTTELFEADFWEDTAFACINCGTCTFVCPTCWCFDIQDETSGLSGVRMRNWDSCMFPLFTLHGSGHNPRNTKTQRVRQRFMHKLKYYVDKYDNGIQCVGCGRCINMCPVNIDIRRVCDLMNNYKP